VTEKEGGVNFSGFAIEIFQKLAQKYGFRYSIYKAPDGNYGSLMDNNTWNGMIGELISGVSIHNNKSTICLFLVKLHFYVSEQVQM